MATSTKKPSPPRTATAPAPGKTGSTKTIAAKAAPASKPLAAKPIPPASPVVGKPVTKAAPSVSVKPKPVKLAKAVKAKKPKLVRDSFTIPKDEYSVLVDLKQRAALLSSPAKKSELLRAGVKALAAMSDLVFVAALKVVPTIKTGRPAKS